MIRSSLMFWCTTILLLLIIILIIIISFDTHHMEYKLSVFAKAKKSLKIPKGLSEYVNRRTDSTMTKRKRTNSHRPHITQKTKDRVTRTPIKKTSGEPMCSGRVSNFCSTSGTGHVNLVTIYTINPSISHNFATTTSFEYYINTSSVCGYIISFIT